MDLRGCPVDNPTNIAGFIEMEGDYSSTSITHYFVVREIQYAIPLTSHRVAKQSYCTDCCCFPKNFSNIFCSFFLFISNLCFISCYTLTTNLLYLILCVKFLEIIVL